jgi:hypothetical protein
MAIADVSVVGHAIDERSATFEKAGNKAVPVKVVPVDRLLEVRVEVGKLCGRTEVSLAIRHRTSEESSGASRHCVVVYSYKCDRLRHAERVVLDRWRRIDIPDALVVCWR